MRCRSKEKLGFFGRTVEVIQYRGGYSPTGKIFRKVRRHLNPNLYYAVIFFYFSNIVLLVGA